MNSVSKLRLCDIARSTVLTVAPDTPIETAIAQFASARVSSLVVAEAGKPVGIVTERDLLHLACTGSVQGVLVRAVMSKPLLTAHVDMDFSAAQLMMSNRAIRHLVLIDEAGDLKGVVSETDFRRHMGADLFAAIQDLRAVMDQGAKLVSPEQPLVEALQSMASRRLDYVIVGRDGRAEGILTERDVPRLLASQVDPAKLRLGEVMTHPLRTIAVDTSVSAAAQLLEQAHLRHLVVADPEGLMVGVVSQHCMLERLSILLIEESRHQLQNRLGLVLETTGVGTWEYDHQREVLIRSQSLNSVLRFPPEKAQETLDEILQRVIPEDQARVAQAFRQLLVGSAEQFSIDYRVVGGDGAVRWMTSRGRVIERDGAGNPLRSVGVAIDIEPRKVAEMQLRQSEARFRGLMESIPMPIGYVNAKLEVVFINPAFVDNFGYTVEDLPDVEAWLHRAYPNENYRAWVRETWQAAALLAARSGQPIRPVERRVTCKNGMVRVVEISGVPMGDDLLTTFVDVTERRQQQALLEFSNAILNHISTSTPLPDVLDFIARKIEAQEPELSCSVLLLDENGKRLRHAAAPSLPADYIAAINGVKIGPLVGSCGTAAYLGKAVFTADISSDPHWLDFRALAFEHGLAACWSSPILSTAGAVLGTFAVYWKQPQAEVDAVTQAYVEAATRLAAIAIESARRENQLRKIQQGLLRAEELGHLGSWSFNLRTGQSLWSDQMFVIFACDRENGAPTYEHYLELVHPGDRALLMATVERLKLSEEIDDIVYRRHPSLGPPCFLQASFSYRRNPDGKVTAFEGTLLDVSITKQAEERLLRQLDELRRWQEMTLGREGRVLELKREVNGLLARLGEAPRYGSVLGDGEQG